jgi:hypothetical protein
MQFQVTLDFDPKTSNKLLTYIQADNLQSAISTINSYNQKHPNWNMRLYSTQAYDCNTFMPVKSIIEV